MKDYTSWYESFLLGVSKRLSLLNDLSKDSLYFMNTGNFYYKFPQSGMKLGMPAEKY